MDDFVVNVRQIGSYPGAASLGANDLLLIQQNGLGGAYANVTPASLVQDALAIGGSIQMKSGFGMEWDSNSNQSFHFDGNGFTFSSTINAPNIAITSGTISGDTIAGTNWVRQQIANLDSSLRFAIDNTVTSFNGRTGAIWLNAYDITWALGVSPGDYIATASYVNNAINGFYYNSALVYSFNGKTGAVTLTTDDVNLAWATSAASSPYVYPQAPNPALGDSSQRVATTMFVDESLDDLYDRIKSEIDASIDLSPYAPLNSPQFSGIPTAPTAAQTSNSGQLATTAFVHAAVTASTTGVASFNGRTGAVLLTTADVTGAGGAPLASPALTGTPTAPTAAPSTNTTQLATTAFVTAAVAAIAAGVTTFNGRNGVVTLTTADVTGAGGAPINSPNLTGTPTAPTAAPATNTTQIATTAYVTAAIAAVGAGVTSFNGRTGAVSLQANDLSAVGGALLASPTFSGVPAAPTAAPGTNTTQLATTGFVTAAIAAGAAGVTSFNSRTGAVVLTTADVTSAGGAPINNAGLTGTPTAPTAVTTDSSTAIATTAFVKNAIAAAPLVSSFNTRTGAITLQASDVSAVGGALLNSPTFTGTPSGPTATVGTSTTQLATTAFVTSALASTVSSFNGRNGAVTLTATDLTNAGGALLASPALSGTPTAPTPSAGTNNTQVATTAFVSNALVNASVVSFTAWSGTDKTSNAVLSNGNLTVTTNNGVAGGVRGVNGFSTGKYYFEITCTNPFPGEGVGIGSASTPLTNNSSTGTQKCMVACTAGTIWLNGAQPGGSPSIGAIGNGALICFAIDLGNQLFWARLGTSGNWNGSGTANPETGAGGIALGMSGTAFFPMAALNAGNSFYAANFGATAFTGSAPSGFTGWTGASAYVAKAGDTMTGLLTIAPASGSYALQTGGTVGSIGLNKTVATNSQYIAGQLNGLARWSMAFGNGAPETGSNAGNDFNIIRYSDAGATLDTPFAIARSSGGIVFGSTGGIAVTGGQMVVQGPGSIAVAAVNASSPNVPIYLTNEAGTAKGSIVWTRASNNMDFTNSSGGNTITLPSAGGTVVGQGMRCKNGMSSGAYGSNTFNSYWSPGTLVCWVDDYNAGTFTLSSDYRIKKDVVDLPGMWDTVKALRPIKYTQAEFTPPSQLDANKKRLADHRDMLAKARDAKEELPPPPQLPEIPAFPADDIERWGFIAHELQETLTATAASGTKDAYDTVQSPNPWTVIAALTKALQEAMTRIEQLEAAA